MTHPVVSDIPAVEIGHSLQSSEMSNSSPQRQPYTAALVLVASDKPSCDTNTSCSHMPAFSILAGARVTTHRPAPEVCHYRIASACSYKVV